MARPSRHPVVIRYHESSDVARAINEFASGASVSMAEAQRLVNRAGLDTLLRRAAPPVPELVG
jgi:hypothetical protein